MIRVTAFVALVALCVALLVNRVSHAGSESSVTAQCADGTLSRSEVRQGTCSRHGGVKTWIK